MSSTFQPSVSDGPTTGPTTGPTIAEANEAIRQYVAGRTVRTQDDLAEPDRLRMHCKSAVQMHITRAA